MIRTRVFSFITALALLLPTLVPAAPVAQAQGGDCPPVPVDEFGNMVLDDMAYTGEQYRECVAACIEIGGEPALGMFLSFQKYRDSSGHTFLVPNFFTALYMAFTGWTPGFAQDPIAVQMNGVGAIAALMGRYDDLGEVFDITPEEATEALGYEVTDTGVLDAEAWAQTVRHFAADAGFWIRLNAMAAWDALTNDDVLSYRAMVLAYCGDPTEIDPPSGHPPGDPGAPGGPGGGDDPGGDDSSTATPPPTPTPQKTVVPTPTATPEPHCAPPSLTRQTGTLTIEKTAPPYPVVVGQDPDKTGVDVYLKIVSYPVVYTYERWEVVGSERHCAWDPDTNVTDDGDKDPNSPGVQTACDLGWEDWSPHDYDRYGCVQYREVHADPVDLGTLRVQANLTQRSKDWIEGELARKYPGARVRHPDWELIPRGGWGAHQSLDGGKVYTLEGTVEGVQLEDPGYYRLVLAGRTTGTPRSQPLTFSYDEQTFEVYLIETALTE